MAIQKTEKIWHNGKLIKWDDATLHVMSHVVHYGSSVFEGIRCYDLPSGPAIFRPTSTCSGCWILPRSIAWSFPTRSKRSSRACSRRWGKNGAWPCYIRPVVFRGYGDAGVNPLQLPGRGLHRQLSVGQVPERRWRGRGRVCLVVDPAGAQHAAGDGQGRRQLHELAAHQDGSAGQRIRGRHRARHERLRQRGLGREPVPGPSRQADHTRRSAVRFCPGSRATRCCRLRAT